jgi:GDPmannose 4,6-dehydratase
MIAIIFGASGQDGIYLSALLKSKGLEVLGIDRNNAHSYSIDNFESICRLVKQYKPVYIFHLAANSTTRHDAWNENHTTISTGTLHILESVKLYSPDTKVFLSGSGLQFVNYGSPISESDDFAATSMYAVSRIQSAYAGRYYRSLGIKSYIGYFFNHDSFYRTERHINKKIIETVKRIAKNSNERLQIGDLTVKKEFGFAPDIVKGILTLVHQEDVFEATIGTGIAYTIEDWLNICFSNYGLNWEEYVDPIPGFKSEYKVLVSNPATIFSLGWEPKTDIYSLAKEMDTL